MSDDEDDYDDDDEYFYIDEGPVAEAVSLVTFVCLSAHYIPLMYQPV